MSAKSFSASGLVIFMDILAWCPVSVEDKVLMLPQRVARSTVAVFVLVNAGLLLSGGSGKMMLPWGWIATELITAQIGLMITDQSSGVTFLERSSILKLGFVFLLVCKGN